MPINKETIISVFDDKLTLMQWLKTINKALEDAVLTGVEITKKGNATLSFKFTFEDGTYLESNDLVLQQGESVENAYIQNGHLYLTLTNGTNLDAGNVKPVSNFSIDANQHLIVNYGDGTSQDLGAIFNGNVNINGNFTANSIIENMEGYSFNEETKANLTIDNKYTSVVKNGNKITFVLFAELTRTGEIENGNAVLGTFAIPSAIGQKLYPYTLLALGSILDTKKINAFDSFISSQELTTHMIKVNNVQVYPIIFGVNNLTLNTKYIYRYEATFLLSDSLVQ